MSADLSEEVEPTALANLQCIDWVRKRISLSGFEALMWKEDHQVVVSDFLATKRDFILSYPPAGHSWSSL